MRAGLSFHLLTRVQRKQRLRSWSCSVVVAAAVTCTVLTLLTTRRWVAPGPDVSHRLDAIIVPGGGLDAGGAPAPWVAARLDAALAHGDTEFYLVLSRGTTHKSAPIDTDGVAIDEAAASARYLIDRGVAPSQILLESWCTTDLI